MCWNSLFDRDLYFIKLKVFCNSMLAKEKTIIERRENLLNGRYLPTTYRVYRAQDLKTTLKEQIF